jgi:hypothetical protein
MVGMDLTLPEPDGPTDWIYGTEDQLFEYLVDNTDRTSRDRVVLAAINAAAGAADSDSERLARIRRLIAARGRARKVHEDDPPS